MIGNLIKDLSFHHWFPLILDYSQDFSIFPLASKDIIDDVSPPKNLNYDEKLYALVQPKSQ
jgi:hypothetical protein